MSLRSITLSLFFSTLFVGGALGVAAAPTDRSAPAAPPLSPPELETIELGNGITMEFVRVAPGTFQMGSPDEAAGASDETPCHKVTLTQPFLFGKCEVTQEQWSQIMGRNPSRFKGKKLPVDTVSWQDCQQFLAKLGEASGRTFALPTEAQWEYACRADTATAWNSGEEATVPGSAWCDGNSDGRTHPVGGKKPNAWGLHDLHGNVGEWCSDWYGIHYSPGDAIDPQGPPGGDSKVVRGGAWGDNPSLLRSASRNANGPDGANHGIGFRCVLKIKS